MRYNTVAGQPTALALLDFLAAFDTNDHDTHLECLKSWLDVCSRALKLFTSYPRYIKIGSAMKTA